MIRTLLLSYLFLAASVTLSYAQLDPTLGRQGKLVLREYNMVVPLLRAGAAVTVEPDARAPAP